MALDEEERILFKEFIRNIIVDTRAKNVTELEQKNENERATERSVRLRRKKRSSFYDI